MSLSQSVPNSHQGAQKWTHSIKKHARWHIKPTISKCRVQTTWSDFWAILTPSPYVDSFIVYLIVLWSFEQARSPLFVYVVCTCPKVEFFLDSNAQIISRPILYCFPGRISDPGSDL